MKNEKIKEITQILKNHNNRILEKHSLGSALTRVEQIAYDATMTVKKRIETLKKYKIL